MPNKSHKTITLPAADAAALAHSEQLADLLRQRISEAGGAISFESFMQAALYEPGLGYYQCGTQKLGAQGDFITAPEMSDLFAQCLVEFYLHSLPGFPVLEVGAGSGRLALSILAELHAQNCLPEKYYILELSSELRQRQYQTIKDHNAELLQHVHWLDGLPEGFSGLVLANELLDAMPLRRFCKSTQGWSELFVARQGNQFALQEYPLRDDRLRQRIEDIKRQSTMDQAEEYCSEVNFIAEDWLKTLGGSLQQAVILLIDYGYPREVYYHAQRSAGTLRCHYQQHAHDDALIMPGIQDITAHIDFTAIADAALEAGMQIEGFATQAHFLLNLGLLERINPESAAQAEQLPGFLQRTGEIKKLTLPGEMGENFKVMAISHQYNGELPGFHHNDIRHLL